MASSIKPTVYLIKPDVQEASDILKDADSLLQEELAIEESEEEAERGEEGVQEILLYYKKSPQHPPKWLPFVQSSFEVDSKDFWNASAYALIILKINNRYFAIPFGMGSHLIDMAKIEYNFGLKVAINSIPENELKQMNLTTPESFSQKTTKQAVKYSTPEEMGINKQKDILRGLAGKLPKDHVLGKRIEGKDSARPTKNIETLDELIDLCAQLLAHSLKTDYKERYPWIDNMAIVSDPITVDSLFDDLLSALKSQSFDQMYISTPELIDDLFVYEGFIFKGNRKRKKTAHVFPDMSDWYNDLGESFVSEMNQDQLRKSCKVYLRDDDEQDRFGWPLSRCIAWEVDKNGSKYILSDGEWYKLDNDFHQEVCDFFDQRVNDNIGLPDATSDYGSEANYNNSACLSQTGFHLFDLGHNNANHKTITNAGNEICDIYDYTGKRFIHVKPGKASPNISHLIRQGAFSARILKTDNDERAKFKGYLEEDGCNTGFVDTYNPSDFTVTYALILGETQRRDIPFFSKVSFKDAVEASIEMMGYKCEFGYISKTSDINTDTDDVAEAA